MKSDQDWKASPRMMESLTALVNFLMSEVRTMENGTEARKKELKDQIPHDKVKDPPALAREFRWRLRQAAGMDSDDEGATAASTIHKPANENKRKRTSASPALSDENGPFKYFRPRHWDKVVERQEDISARQVTVPRPTKHEDGDDNWEESWVEGTPNGEAKEDKASVQTRKEVVIKVRRTEKGIERHRIERIIEVWNWT